MSANIVIASNDFALAWWYDVESVVFNWTNAFHWSKFIVISVRPFIITENCVSKSFNFWTNKMQKWTDKMQKKAALINIIMILCDIYVLMILCDIYVLMILWHICIDDSMWHICVNDFMWHICINDSMWHICINDFMWHICIDDSDDSVTYMY